MKPAQAPVPPSTGLLAEDPSVAEKMMEFAIEAAAIGRANGFRGCGAVVYDPMWKQMRGWAYDQTQYLGVPSTEAASASSSSSSASAGASAEPGWSERVHPLHTASLLVIEAIAVADRRRRGAFDRVREAKAGLNWDPASPSVTGQAARPPGAGTAVSEVRPPTLPPAAVRSSSAGAAASSSSPSDTSDATETTVPSTRHHAAATTTRKRERPNDTALQPKGTATSPSSATAAATGDDDDEEDANSVAVDGGVDGGADAETEAETEAPPSGKRSASRADAVVGAALSGRASKHLTPRSKGTYLYDVPVLALPDTEPVPSVPGDDQYICTGYDVFLSVEPSAMDAMALSHSRVRSVFFATPDATDGALVSRLRLHEAKALNHHYRVFQLDPSNRLTKQAAELWASPYGEGAGNPFRCDPARSASVRAFRAKGDQSEALE
jgi:tRNA(Arg) A34 adenosine deaminase TadA